MMECGDTASEVKTRGKCAVQGASTAESRTAQVYQMNEEDGWECWGEVERVGERVRRSAESMWVEVARILS